MPNANLIIVTRMKGLISPIKLNIALVRVKVQHPPFGTRILLNEKNMAWFNSNWMWSLVVFDFFMRNNMDIYSLKLYLTHEMWIL